MKKEHKREANKKVHTNISKLNFKWFTKSGGAWSANHMVLRLFSAEL